MQQTDKELIQKICDAYPELANAINEDEGLLHLQVSAFGRHIQSLIDERKVIQYKDACKLFVDLFENCSPAFRNALYVSLLEHLNFEDSKRTNRQWAFEAMPTVMNIAWQEINDYNDNLHKK